MTSFVMGTLVTDPKIRTQSLTARCATIVFSASASFSLPSMVLLTEKPRSGIALLCKLSRLPLPHMTHFHTSYHPFHLALRKLSASKYRCHQSFQSLAEDCPDSYCTCTAAILPAHGHRSHWLLSLSSCGNTNGSLLICLCLVFCFLAEGMTNLWELD